MLTATVGAAHFVERDDSELAGEILHDRLNDVQQQLECFGADTNRPE